MKDNRNRGKSASEMPENAGIEAENRLVRNIPILTHENFRKGLAERLSATEEAILKVKPEKLLQAFNEKIAQENSAENNLENLENAESSENAGSFENAESSENLAKQEGASVKKNFTPEEVRAILDAVSAKLEEKGAKKMELIDVHEQTTLADYFLICTGTSNTHIRTLCQEVERLMETEYGMRAHHIEGYETAQWILVDFVFFVVHIFRADVREFYSLERLWA